MKNEVEAVEKKNYACVYGGAADKIDETIRNDIEKLGEIIAENGYSLVYGGGASGCMGAVANGVRKKNGYIMGITPHFIGEFEAIFDCDDTVMVESMSERKTLMEKQSDIFFIAPGGIGTLDEFFQILVLKYLGQTTAPIVVLNLNGFYNSLLKLIDDLVAFGATSEKIYELFDVVTEIDNSKISGFFTKTVG